MSQDRFILRSITDEIMYAIMELSGQEYVDIYAPAARGGGPRSQGTGGRRGVSSASTVTSDASRAGRPQADDDCAIRGPKGVGEGYVQKAGTQPSEPRS
jgi:1-acyl-sn-glycerol-3-phosphate acyltransferase